MKSRPDGSCRATAHFKFLFLSGESYLKRRKWPARWIDVNSALGQFSHVTPQDQSTFAWVNIELLKRIEESKGGGFFHLLILRLDFHICLSSLMQVIHYRLGGVLLSTTCGHTSTTTNPSWVPSFHFHSSLTKSLEQVFPLTLLEERLTSLHEYLICAKMSPTHLFVHLL